MATLKSLSVHRYCVVVSTFSGPFGLLDSKLLFGNRVALNPGLEAWWMSHLQLSLMHRLNQTESAFSYCWCCILKDLLTDYLCFPVGDLIWVFLNEAIIYEY